MKTVKVVAAIITNPEMTRVFATARGYGEYKGQWEFPGGKVEQNETGPEALVREIQEELNTLISVNEYFDTIEYDYQDFHLSMECYLCTVIEGNLELLEAEDSLWLTKDSLFSVQWLPADLTIIEKLKEILHTAETNENVKD